MSRRADTDHDEVETAILDALVEGPSAGMTVFELRSHVDYDIETIEPALARLRADELIVVEYDEERSVIRPVEDARADHQRPMEPPGWFERVRRRFFDR